MTGPGGTVRVSQAALLDLRVCVRVVGSRSANLGLLRSVIRPCWGKRGMNLPARGTIGRGVAC